MLRMFFSNLVHILIHVDGYSSHNSTLINLVYIDVENLLDYKVSLYSINGKVLEVFDQTNVIHVDVFPAGTYLLEVEDLNSGQKAIERLVVTNK